MRNWLIGISIGVVLLVGGAVAVVLGSAPTLGVGGPPAVQSPESSPNPEPRDLSAEAPDEPTSDASAPEPGPNGRLIEPVPEDREVKTEGLPARPDAVPPADGPEVWAARREEQDATWRLEVMSTTEAWAKAEALPADDRRATLAALENMHGALGQIRREMLEGTLGRREGREGMARIRREARASLVQTLGEERVERLLLALDTHLGGGF